MILCDLCGQAKECRQREIDGKEYDICADCWNPLAEKLKGKGRRIRVGETVYLPPATKDPAPEPEKPAKAPRQPPKIWGQSRLQ